MPTNLTFNPNLAVPFEAMQNMIEDRVNGVRYIHGLVIFEDKLSPLSPGWTTLLNFDDRMFNSVDHLVQYMKAVAFRDQVAANKISGTADPRTYLAVKIDKFSTNAWKRWENEAVKVATGVKFAQSTEAMTTLRDTRTKRLVYANKDTYWGCGLVLTDQNAAFPQYWSGMNNLGKVLQNIRSGSSL